MPARVAVAVGGYVAEAGAPGDAAGVLGAAVALRGVVDQSDPDRGRLEERLRAELGDTAYDQAFAAGRALPRERAEELLAQLLEPARAGGPAPA